MFEVNDQCLLSDVERCHWGNVVCNLWIRWYVPQPQCLYVILVLTCYFVVGQALSAAVGYGNAAGFLYNKGIMAPPPASSGGDDVNPITGKFRRGSTGGSFFTISLLQVLGKPPLVHHYLKCRTKKSNARLSGCLSCLIGWNVWGWPRIRFGRRIRAESSKTKHISALNSNGQSRYSPVQRVSIFSRSASDDIPGAG